MKKKVNGYEIREALRSWKIKKDMSARVFADSVHAFPDEDKVKPEKAFAEYTVADMNIAELEAAQQLYNLSVTVTVMGEEMTLARAVKLVGGAGRAEKMWREVAIPKKDRYGYDRDLTRNADEVRAVRQISSEKATEYAMAASSRAAAIRSAIATGNSVAVEIDFEDLSIFG